MRDARRAPSVVLLENMDDAPSLPTVPVLDPSSATTGAAGIVLDTRADADVRIDGYTITGVLGAGGMGVVHRAEQHRPLRREVALKLVRRGLDTDRLIARFEAERLALARMNHPGIAQVFDAGATSDGRPYFVMELVDGPPLTEFCDANRLPIRDRLQLFVLACRAVQHAHQKGIVHRDLKPSNILVTQDDGRPVPKVIDFGIAKVMADGDDDGVLLTRAGQMVGTPEFMSPEQAGVVDADVDTRTDVYALGVLLYELLAGHRPHRFAAGTRDEVHRVLRAQPTARPSTAVGTRWHGRFTPMPADSGTSPLEQAAAAAARRTTPERLRRILSGDLDTIVLKAMAFEPARRYPSVDQLAEDVERYLIGQPVQARPDSWRYRAGKFARRHRYWLSAAAMALATLVAFSIVTAVQSARVARERDRAEQALARTEAVNSFLVGMFRQADPRQALGTSLTAEQMLERAAGALESDLREAPDVRSQLLQSLANVYKQLGQYDRSERLTVHAVALRREGAPLVLADSLDALGDVRRYAGRANDAVAPLEEALRLRVQHLGDQHRDVAETVNNFALVRHEQGRFAEAESLHRRALAIWERGDAREAGEDLVALGLTNLGRSVRAQGRSREAASLFERGLRIRRERLASTNPRIATSLHYIALTHADEGRFDDAAGLLREALELRASALGETHPQTLATRAQLARVLLRGGDRTAAAGEAHRVLRDATDNPNAPAIRAAEAEIVLAEIARDAGRLAEARDRVARARRLLADGRRTSQAHDDLVRLEAALQDAR